MPGFPVLPSGDAEVRLETRTTQSAGADAALSSGPVAHRTALIAHDLGWETPSGDSILAHLTFALGPERTGLIGPNGVGKTTLLELLLGLRAPTTGHIERSGDIAFLPQRLEIHCEESVARMLGIDGRLDALRRLQSGIYDDGLLEVIGNDWDIAERAAALLDRLGLGHLELDRPPGTLSGGETTRVALAGQMLRSPDFLVLDEPTNNLDLESRQALYQVIDEWTAGLLVVSHDRSLLEHVDQILELTPRGITLYGGPYDAYLEQKAVEEEAIRRQVSQAEGQVRRDRREAQAAHERQEKRQATGKRRRERGGIPRIMMNAMRESAQNTGARLKGVHEERMAESGARLARARERILPRNVIQIDLERTEVPSGRLVARLVDVAFCWPGASEPLLEEIGLELTGPARVALKGPNGSGKTTLIRLLLGELTVSRGEVRVGVEEVAWLDQHTGLLKAEERVIDAFRRFSPGMEESMRRLRLGRFLFRGEAALKPVRALSGGERMRLALACVLAGDRPPRLLILDEPTNNLDLDSIEQLESALHNYRGALLVVSHDERFLENVGVERVLELAFQAR